MNLKVKINKVFPETSKVRAIATVAFDEAFCVHGVKVIDASKGRFVAMPQTKTNDEYFDIFHPLNNDARHLLCNAVIAAYDDYIKNGPTENNN